MPVARDEHAGEGRGRLAPVDMMSDMAAGAAAFPLDGVVAVFVFALVVYVWVAFALGAVFRKAEEPSWPAWVPVYNTAVLLRLGGFSGWWVLLGFVPVADAALYVIVVAACHRVNRAFAYGAGMTVLAALLFPVWAGVLGWGAAGWVGTDRRARAAGDAALARHVAPSPAPVAVAPSGESDAPAREPIVIAPDAPGHGGFVGGSGAARLAGAGAPGGAPRRPIDESDLDDASAGASAGVSDPSPWAPPVIMPTPPRVPDRPAVPLRSALAQRAPADWDDDGIFDETVIVHRGPSWALTSADGIHVAVTSDVIIVGRGPTPDPMHPAAQLVAVDDHTRTMSKTHARLERADDRWIITDLHSTNGVVLVDADGAEAEIAPGHAEHVIERFLLGDVAFRLTRSAA